VAIEKRGTVWYYRFTHRGVEYRASTGLEATAPNLKSAEQVEALAKLEAIAGVTKRPALTGQTLLDAAADDFLRWCFSTEYRSKPNTARRLQVSFQSILVFMGDKPVSEIDANTIESYKTWRFTKHHVKDVTVRHDLHALSVFFRKYAIRKKLAVLNPVDQVSKPSDKDAVRIHILSAEEEDRYFAHARGTLYDVARLILLQGCRPEEVLSIRPENVIEDDEPILRIPGGKSRAARRDLPLTRESLAILQGRKAKHGATGWLFPSPRIEGAHVVKLNAQHDRVCLEAGVSFVLYDLRHTWATRALTEAGLDVATVAALMGHASPTIVLKHYAHPTEAAKRAGMKRYEELVKPKLRRVK
jgi:integrase